MPNKKIKILMVCLGNICRSPTAEVVFRQKVTELELQEYFEIDSAGTGDWHIDHAPDSRATLAAAKRELDLSPLRARLVEKNDFQTFDYIFAMDKENLKNLRILNFDIDAKEEASKSANENKVTLFLTHANGKPTQGYEEVPDPYYSGDEGFELVLDLIEEASTKIIASLISQHNIAI